MHIRLSFKLGKIDTTPASEHLSFKSKDGY